MKWRKCCWLHGKPVKDQVLSLVSVQFLLWKIQCSSPHTGPHVAPRDPHYAARWAEMAANPHHSVISSGASCKEKITHYTVLHAIQISQGVVWHAGACMLESRGNGHMPTCTVGARPKDFKGPTLLFADVIPQMFYPPLVSTKTMSNIS